MRVLVCGGRDYTDRQYLNGILCIYNAVNPISCVISGCARGADTLAIKWAEANNIPVAKFPADWEAYGKAAGHIRNLEMIIEGKPDVAFVFPGGRGTENMAMQLSRHNIPYRRIKGASET